MQLCPHLQVCCLAMQYFPYFPLAKHKVILRKVPLRQPEDVISALMSDLMCWLMFCFLRDQRLSKSQVLEECEMKGIWVCRWSVTNVTSIVLLIPPIMQDLMNVWESFVVSLIFEESYGDCLYFPLFLFILWLMDSSPTAAGSAELP